MCLGVPQFLRDPIFFTCITVVLWLRYRLSDVADKLKDPPLNNLPSVESVRELLRVCVNTSPLFGVVALPLRSTPYGPGDTADAGIFVDPRDVSRLLINVVSANDLPIWAANALGTLFGLDVPTLPVFGILDTDCPCYVSLRFTIDGIDPKAGAEG